MSWWVDRAAKSLVWDFLKKVIGQRLSSTIGHSEGPIQISTKKLTLDCSFFKLSLLHVWITNVRYSTNNLLEQRFHSIDLRTCWLLRSIRMVCLCVTGIKILDETQNKRGSHMIYPNKNLSKFILPNAKIKLILEEESKEAGFGEGYNFWYDKLAVMFVDVRMT